MEFCLHTLHGITQISQLIIAFDVKLVEKVRISQLVRRICPYCGEEYEPSAAEEGSLGIKIQPGTKFRRGRGCQQCFETEYRL